MAVRTLPEAVAMRNPKSVQPDLQRQRKALPIASAEARLVEEVKQNSTLIVIGETGSGKTTQLPQYLHGAGLTGGGILAVTQPRRVAAISVANRVAQEMGTGVGQEVGFTVRFEDMTSARTKIKYLTDGMLLREALLDPFLRKYSVIIVDEAHERTVSTDILFGLLKEVQKRRGKSARKSDEMGAKERGVENGERKKRSAEGGFGKLEKVQENKKPRLWLESVGGLASNGSGKGEGEKMELDEKLLPLKLVIMSATLEAEKFCDYFVGAKAVYVQGRQFPVEVFYTPTPEADYLDAALITILQIHMEEEEGDVLVFLTGQEEIEDMERLLVERATRLPAGSADLAIAPIFAALPAEQQMKVFQPPPKGSRKVVLATNIAETSLTIPGIRFVVDPGLVKARAFNPKTGVESLVVVPISKAQARQRSGRAGREASGKCFRLYTEGAFEGLDESTVPEIKRCNPASMVLQLKAFGVDDILGFEFMDKPPRAAVLKALQLLYTLGALTSEGKLSEPLGFQMAKFPLEPLYAKALLVSGSFKCLEEMVVVVAMLSVESPFFTPKGKLAEARAAKKRFISSEGDHWTLVNAFRAYMHETNKSRESLKEISSVETTKESRSKKSKEAQVRLRNWCSENFLNNRAMRKAEDMYRQIRGYCEGMGLPIVSCGDERENFQRCLAAAFFLHAAQRQPDGLYRALASGQSVTLHPSSVLFERKPEFVVFNEMVRTTKQYIRDLTQIEPQWLAELAPKFYSVNGSAFFSKH